MDHWISGEKNLLISFFQEIQAQRNETKAYAILVAVYDNKNLTPTSINLSHLVHATSKLWRTESDLDEKNETSLRKITVGVVMLQ